MNENIDLTKILEGCPKGTKLYSTLQGEVSFLRIDIFDTHPIVLTVHNKCTDTTVYDCYSKDGKYNSFYDGECVLFPSKDQRDWSKFVRFWDKPKAEKFDPKTLQPFDKVLLRIDERGIWQPDFFGYKDGNCITCVTYGNVKCIPYNKETKHLVGTNNDCPEYYKWWEEQKL